jgi:sterol desaturase/sphingolipid hydroxylase (fatty acid hydroxylase superfamily)
MKAARQAAFFLVKKNQHFVMELTALASVIKTFIEHDPVGFAVPVFILFILAELYLSYRESLELYKGKDAWASIAMGLGSVFVNLFSKSIYFLLFNFIHQNFRLFNINSEHIWAWVLLFFLDDFSFYWHHRLSHQIEILWAAHSNHHSSEYYNFSTALRQSWTEFLYKYIFWVPIAFLGFPPMMIFTMISFSLIYQFFLHTETVRKLGFFELIFNTPSHHRVHHATNLQYLDKNHAGILIIWDKIFGTFEPENEENKPVFGLTKNICTFNPVKIAFAEYAEILQNLRNAKSFAEVMKYLFYPPGWSPDGRSKTTRELLGHVKNNSK